MHAPRSESLFFNPVDESLNVTDFDWGMKSFCQHLENRQHQDAISEIMNPHRITEQHDIWTLFFILQLPTHEISAGLHPRIRKLVNRGRHINHQRIPYPMKHKDSIRMQCQDERPVSLFHTLLCQKKATRNIGPYVNALRGHTKAWRQWKLDITCILNDNLQSCRYRFCSESRNRLTNVHPHFKGQHERMHGRLDSDFGKLKHRNGGWNLGIIQFFSHDTKPSSLMPNANVGSIHGFMKDRCKNLWNPSDNPWVTNQGNGIQYSNQCMRHRNGITKNHGGLKFGLRDPLTIDQTHENRKFRGNHFSYDRSLHEEWAINSPSSDKCIAQCSGSSITCQNACCNGIQILKPVCQHIPRRLFSMATSELLRQVCRIKVQFEFFII